VLRQPFDAYLAVHDAAALNLPQVVLLQCHTCRNNAV
jgi:hypothetical protein